MDLSGAYEPKRAQTTQEKIDEWLAQAAALLNLQSEPNQALHEELTSIFDENNFTDSGGQLAIRDIARLKDLKQDRESIILFLKDKYKYHQEI